MNGTCSGTHIYNQVVSGFCLVRWRPRCEPLHRFASGRATTLPCLGQPDGKPLATADHQTLNLRDWCDVFLEPQRWLLETRNGFLEKTVRNERNACAAMVSFIFHLENTQIKSIFLSQRGSDASDKVAFGPTGYAFRVSEARHSGQSSKTSFVRVMIGTLSMPAPNGAGAT